MDEGRWFLLGIVAFLVILAFIQAGEKPSGPVDGGWY